MIRWAAISAGLHMSDDATHVGLTDGVKMPAVQERMLPPEIFLRVFPRLQVSIHSSVPTDSNVPLESTGTSQVGSTVVDVLVDVVLVDVVVTTVVTEEVVVVVH